MKQVTQAVPTETRNRLMAILNRLAKKQDGVMQADGYGNVFLKLNGFRGQFRIAKFPSFPDAEHFLFAKGFNRLTAMGQGVRYKYNVAANERAIWYKKYGLRNTI